MLYGRRSRETEAAAVGTVDIPGLAKVGTAVADSAAGFEQAHAAHAARLRIGGSSPAWAGAEAAATAADRWGAFLRQVAGQVRALGADLTRSAADHRAADDAAARRISAAGIPAGHPAAGRAHGYGPR
jgi:hypothetical protein